MDIGCFTEQLCSNTYTVTATDGSAAVIDPGYVGQAGYEAALKFGSKLKYILLTHRHSDHILAAARLKSLTGAKIAIHRLDKVGLTDPNASLFDMVSSYYCDAQELTEPDILLEDGDKLTFSDICFEVMHTPGHTVGSVCFICDKAVFTGDTLFEGSIGRTDFPTGSDADMIESLSTLSSLNGDFTLYPGHGEVTTLNNEREFNRYMRNCKNGRLYY